MLINENKKNQDMENLNVQTSKTEEVGKIEKGLFVTIALSVIVVIILAIVGFLCINKNTEVVQGEVDANSVRVSGLMPGRVEKFYVAEGQYVHAGDTLAKIYSATVDAKLAQALAGQDAATALKQKADAGTRRQTLEAARNLMEQAKAALEIRKKTYERVEALYSQDVVPAQKRDEAKAAYDAAVAQFDAAQSQYNLAKEGAQKEDKMAAAAKLRAAEGTVAEVKSILQDQYLFAPCDGEISDIFPHIGELVSTGTPIMNVLKLEEKWFVFNVRESMLADMTMGKTVTLKVPAFDMKEIQAEVYYIKDMGEYAVWRSTKMTGEYDSKTFEVRLKPKGDVKDLRPGMSVILK